MDRPPADVFGQALLEDPPHDPNCIFVANRREYRESVGLEVGPWEPATEDGKGKAPPPVGRMWLVELKF